MEDYKRAPHQRVEPRNFDEHLTKLSGINPLLVILALLISLGVDVWLCLAWDQFRQHTLSIPYGSHVRLGYVARVSLLATAAGWFVAVPLFIKGMSLNGSQRLRRYGVTFVGLVLCSSSSPLSSFFFFSIIESRRLIPY